MKIPATVMSTLALVLIILGRVEAHNNSPCLRNPDNNAYNKFVSKHILQDTFNTGSNQDWKRYLIKYKLCGRPRQSFMRQAGQGLVSQICNGRGRILRDNLCTSTSRMLVYELTVNTANCKVTSRREERKYVVVACDKVSNRCLPVHYVGSNNNAPSSRQTCRP